MGILFLVAKISNVFVVVVLFFFLWVRGWGGGV